MTEPTDRKNLRVLVVDDHVKMRRMIANMLKTNGFEKVADAPDGDEALAKIQAGGIDLVVCDWNMPRMKGVEVLEILRSRDATKDLPFLMVTAEVDEKTVMQALEGEVDAYIIKPFKTQTLLDKIDYILRKRTQPGPIDQHLRRGNAFLNSGNPQMALTEFKKALGVDSESPRSHYHVGLAHEKIKDYKSAVRSFRRALEISPQFVRAYDALAGVYKATGKTQEAIDALAEAAALSPRNSERQGKLGTFHIEAGNLDKGKQILNEVRKANPKDADLASRIGEVFLKAGMNEEAEAAFGSALTINPDMHHLYNRLGIAYRKQGKVKEAIENYKTALKLAPNDVNLYFNLGVAFLEGKDVENARKALTRAVQLNPDFQEAGKLLSRIQAVPA